MTTITRTRKPLETLSMSQPSAGRRRSKRLLQEYDEEDGDFIFARASKKAKTAPADPEPVPAPPPPKKASKKGKEKVRDEEPTVTVKKTRGRKMSFSTPNEEKDSISVPKQRKTTRSSVGKTQINGVSNGMLKPSIENDSIDLVGLNAQEESSISAVDLNKQGTIIYLPFSDTPVANRNKEMRKKGTGARRSSLGMRGRRASSLIDNGHSALPHREVETSEFYKHIEAEGLSEPRRMKQLLTWTGERALGDKPSHGNPDRTEQQASLAARVIKESLLKDFANKSEFSDWFSREEQAPVPVPTKMIKKPNPRNIEIAETLESLESRVKRLKEERDQWKALGKPPTQFPPLFFGDSDDLLPGQIDASFLDPEQAAILATISSSTAVNLRNQISDRLRTIQSSLEFKVDQFADGIHKLEQYQETIGRVADRILALSAVRLEERDRREREAVGTRDLPVQEVLRSLSRILPDSGMRRT